MACPPSLTQSDGWHGYSQQLGPAPSGLPPATPSSCPEFKHTTASSQGCCQSLSPMTGNGHVGFLGEGVTATSPSYPTLRSFAPENFAYYYSSARGFVHTDDEDTNCENRFNVDGRSESQERYVNPIIERIMGSSRASGGGRHPTEWDGNTRLHMVRVLPGTNWVELGR